MSETHSGEAAGLRECEEAGCRNREPPRRGEVAANPVEVTREQRRDDDREQQIQRSEHTGALRIEMKVLHQRADPNGQGHEVDHAGDVCND
jgi:hypothetical protein